MVYKISELIGKQAITLTEAGQQGVVLGVYFDKALSKCKGFSLLSGDDESKYFVDLKDFSSLLSDAAVIRSSDCLKEAPPAHLADSPINLPAFNQDGKSLGIIRDINLNGSDVVSFVCDGGCEIASGTLLSRSDSIVVFNDTGVPIKIKKPSKPLKKQGEKTAETEKPSPAAADSGAAAKPERLPEIPKIPYGRLRAGDVQSTPLRQTDLINKYYFLLGKRLQRSIYSNDGKLIARENELVSEKIIGLARQNGKLVAVALHSL